MLFYNSAKVINDLCCQIYLTLIGIFNQIVILVLKQLDFCVFDFDQCTGSVLIVAYKKLYCIVALWLQNTVFLDTIPVSIKLTVFLLCRWSNFSEFLCFLARQYFVKKLLFDDKRKYFYSRV